MKKTIVLFLVILGALILVGLADDLVKPYSDLELQALLKKIFAHWPWDKSERLVFITEDGQVFLFDNEDESGVTVNRAEISRTLFLKGQSFKTVTNVIHNHPSRPGDDFSRADIEAYRTLKAMGFAGAFQIYYPTTGKIKTFKGRLP